MVPTTIILTWTALIAISTFLGGWNEFCYHVTSFQPTVRVVQRSSFNHHDHHHDHHHHRSLLVTPPRTKLSATGWQEKLQEFFGMDQNEETTNKNDSRQAAAAAAAAAENNNDTKVESAGVVIRIAARPFDSDSSKPSSRSYTTRKVELAPSSGVPITREGVQGDYNHYRTVALKSTHDRAVSLLTTDVMTALRSEYPQYAIEDGDLGENISVDGVSFDFFRIGERYKFVSVGDENEESSSPSSSSNSNSGIIVEITEKMDPCANLCKLSYINDGSLQPKQRIARCQDFLHFFDRYDGYRGWYAKVIQEGTMFKGGKVIRLLEDN